MSEKFILDTNLFFNMEPGLELGKKTEDVIKIVTERLKSKKKEVECYMPPRIVEEFLGFFDDREQPFLKEFLGVVTTKSPDISKVTFPAEVFYQLVEDIRARSYRGLVISEEEIKSAATKLVGAPAEGKKEFEIKVGVFIKTLRDRYRQATRHGFLDSLADLDIIVLAKELDAYVVSTDEGVIVWGRAFGVKEMEASIFGQKLAG